MLTPLQNYLGRLRHPQLFLLLVLLWLADLAVPDFIPFIDEILLGLATLFLGQWKRRQDNSRGIQR